LEVTLVVLVLGILLALATPAWQLTMAQQEQTYKSSTQLARLEALLIDFAARHHRLPCPDTNGNGHEGMNGGCNNTAVLGWLPYATLGLDPDTPFRDVVYALHRSAGADLAQPSSGNLSPAGAGAHQARRDFLQALKTAARAPVGALPVVTGDGVRQGVIDCATNPVSSPAFVLLLRGEDADDDGRRADDLNPDTSTDSACFAGAGRPADTAYDDSVSLVGHAYLYGQLVRL
ncbi:MAG: hypothetical protein ACPHXW_06775, partial [Marinobacterium sp.]